MFVVVYFILFTIFDTIRTSRLNREQKCKQYYFEGMQLLSTGRHHRYYVHHIVTNVEYLVHVALEYWKTIRHKSPPECEIGKALDTMKIILWRQ